MIGISTKIKYPHLNFQNNLSHHWIFPFSMLIKWKNKSYLRLCSTLKRIPSKKLLSRGKLLMMPTTIVTINRLDSTISMLKKIWIKRKMRRKRCREWEEIKWKEQPWWIQCLLIAISNKKKYAAIVKIKILPLDMSVNIVRYPFSFLNCSIWMIGE